MRKEKDSLGCLDLPKNALWGIHTHRALQNFSFSSRPIPAALIQALATVKQAAAQTHLEQGNIEKEKALAIVAACQELLERGEKYEKLFPLDALQGGAGTSTNMNMNEVLANLALKSLGKEPGDYEYIHPIHHVNLHQSTNDVYPTALKIAAIKGCRTLSDAFATLQGALQKKEKEFQEILKIGRTEMTPAVPMRLGQEFSAFAEAIARDRWRCFKCEERLRLVNIGGTAIGTGLAASREYIFRVIEVLRDLTGMGLSRSENLLDGTANADAFVEVSGILKAAASNLSKIAGDLRLLHTLGEITLPPVQAGSSIMPGKINPVMVEAVLQISMVVRANDFVIGECAAHGTLQINEFMPLIAVSLLESIELLTRSAHSLAAHVEEITADTKKCKAYLKNAPTLMTALLPHMSYGEAQTLIEKFQEERAKNPEVELEDFLSKEVGKELSKELLDDQKLLRLGNIHDKKET